MQDYQLLRVPEVCFMLSIGRSTVYELINSGELKAVRIGKAVRVSRGAIDAYVTRLEAANG